jgi:Galactose oxidase, central domain
LAAAVVASEVFMSRANWVRLIFTLLALALGVSCGDDDDAVGVGHGGKGGSGGSGGTSIISGASTGGVAGATCEPVDRLIVSWQLLAREASPGPRALHAIAAFDDGLLLYGGQRAGAPLADTWQYDGDAKGFQRSVDDPEARAAHALAGVGASVLLFGGLGEAGLLDDSWLWTRDGWTGVCGTDACATAPSARSHHAMASDATGKRVVLFGGTDGRALGDTWTWDESGWTSVCSTPRSNDAAAGAGGMAPSENSGGAANAGADACGPAPRADHALVLDTATQNIVVYGGGDGIRDFDDVWRFDGEVWQPIPVSGDIGPGARSGHSMAVDPASGLILVVGGTHDGLLVSDDVWGLDTSSGHWLLAEQSLERPQRRTHSVLVAEGRRLLLYGGGADPELQDLWQLKTRRIRVNLDCSTEGGEGGAGGAAGGSAGHGGLGGAPPDGGAGVAGVGVGEPVTSSCQRLLVCCDGLPAPELQACRRAAFADDAPNCDQAVVLCEAKKTDPDQDGTCLELAACCPTLEGSLKDDCTALLSDTPAHCNELLAGGYCVAAP